MMPARGEQYPPFTLPGYNMKMVPAILLFVALSTFAQTNEPVIGVLPAGGQFYNNALIS
jgi:hypothetical protein